MCGLALLIIKEPTLIQYKSPFSSFYMYEAKILKQKKIYKSMQVIPRIVRAITQWTGRRIRRNKVHKYYKIRIGINEQ